MGIIGRPDQDGRIEKMVRYMQVGERGFMSVFNIEFDLNGTPFLNLAGPVYGRKGRSRFEVSIIRRGVDLDAFDIDLRTVRYVWRYQEIVFSDYDDINPEEDVVRLSYNPLPTHPPKEFRIATPHSRKAQLERDMHAAVAEEDYERAAIFRDQLKNLSQPKKKIKRTHQKKKVH